MIVRSTEALCSAVKGTVDVDFQQLEPLLPGHTVLIERQPAALRGHPFRIAVLIRARVELRKLAQDKALGVECGRHVLHQDHLHTAKQRGRSRRGRQDL